MALGLPHILSVSDCQSGIMALAARLLSSQDLWPELVQANNLIPPYVTTNPIKAYGQPMDTQSATAVLAAGSTQTPLSASVALWAAGDTVVFVASGSTGLVSEAHTITSYDGATLQWSGGLQDAYPVGAQMLSYPANVIQGSILMPGSTMFLPLDLLPSGFTLTTGAQLTDVIGSDALSPVTFQDGDLATVAGPALLAQRVRAALTTLLGSLPQALGWGSGIPQTLGAPTNDTRAMALARQALLKLPEITQVTELKMTVDGDQKFITANITLSTTNTVLSLVNEPLTSPISN